MRRNMVQNISIRKRRVAETEAETETQRRRKRTLKRWQAVVAPINRFITSPGPILRLTLTLILTLTPSPVELSSASSKAVPDECSAFDVLWRTVPPRVLLGIAVSGCRSLSGLLCSPLFCSGLVRSVLLCSVLFCSVLFYLHRGYYFNKNSWILFQVCYGRLVSRTFLLHLFHSSSSIQARI